MKLGFFDSGIGGLTVLNEAIKAFPQAHYIYFADTDNVPYGTKSKKKIKVLVFDAVDFMAKKNIDVLVVACNTATSVCIKALRARYDFPIIGMEPAVKPAAHNSATKKGSRIMVSATKLTLKEKKLHDLIKDLNISDKTDLISLQKLVKFAEKFDMNSPKLQKYLNKKLTPIEWKNYDSLVLGCTHFLYYEKQIARRIPSHIQLINGNAGTINRLLYFIKKHKRSKNTVSKTKLAFYKSKVKTNTEELQRYLDFLES